MFLLCEQTNPETEKICPACDVHLVVGMHLQRGDQQVFVYTYGVVTGEWQKVAEAVFGLKPPARSAQDNIAAGKSVVRRRPTHTSSGLL